MHVILWYRRFDKVGWLLLPQDHVTSFRGNDRFRYIKKLAFGEGFECKDIVECVECIRGQGLCVKRSNISKMEQGKASDHRTTRINSI